VISVSLKFKKKVFNVGKWKKNVSRKASELRDQSAREFIDATVSRIPVYEGTARATLIPLGRIVNKMVPIGGVKTPPRSGRGIAAGAAKASASRFGNQFIRGFKWNHDVLHYALSDTVLSNKSAPWLSVEAGREAAMAYLEANALAQFPSPLDYIENG